MAVAVMLMVEVVVVVTVTVDVVDAVGGGIESGGDVTVGDAVPV